MALHLIDVALECARMFRGCIVAVRKGAANSAGDDWEDGERRDYLGGMRDLVHHIPLIKNSLDVIRKHLCPHIV